MSALEIFGSVLSSCWDVLAFEIPGLGVSCQQFVIALVILNISLAALNFVFDLGGSGTGYRSGSGGKKHISDNRKDDEY